MSRIGKKPVPVGAAKVTVQDHLVRVEGPKGKLEQQIPESITVKLDGDKKELVVTRPDDEKQNKALHGLVRSLLANMVEGVPTATRSRWRSRASATRPSSAARTSCSPSATPTRSRSRSPRA